MARKNFWKVILLIFFIAFTFRIGFAFYLEERFYFDDEYEYWKIVDNFISGKGLMVAENLKAYRPPLYPLFIALLVKTGFTITGIRIVQSFLSAITCVFIYLISKKIFSERVALLSCFLSAIYPFFIFYTGFLLTETFFIFLVVLCALTMFTLVEPKVFPSYGLVFGATSGFAGLCRPTMELFFPFCLLFILFSADNNIIRLKKILFAFAGFILVLTPWIIRNYIAIGKFVPGTTMGGAVFWEGNNPFSEGGPCRYFPEGVWQVDEAQRDRVFYSLTFECIKKDPQRFLRLLGKKFFRFWNIVPNAAEYSTNFYRALSVLSFGLLLPFFILGLFITKHSLKTLFLVWTIVFFTIFHMIFLASIRYRVAIEPFVIMFASNGFLWLIFQLKGINKS